MQVLTPVDEQTGTRLRIDADRLLQDATRDSVLRVRGELPEHGQAFDATYVEVDQDEAQTVAASLRALTAPPARLQDMIAQEVLAAFGSRLGGRDVQQIAVLTTRALGLGLASVLGREDDARETRVNALAERFERAASQRRNAHRTAALLNGESPAG